MNTGLDDLIGAWLAGDLDETKRLALEDRLRSDPAARHRFAEQCCLDMALGQHLRTRSAALGDPTPSSVLRIGTDAVASETATLPDKINSPKRPRPRRQTSRSINRGQRRRARRQVIVGPALVGTAIVLMVWVFIALNQTPGSGSETADPGIASLLAGSMRFAGSTDPIPVGTDLPTGSHLRCSTPVHLRLHRPQADLRLQAGSELRLGAANIMDLEQGGISLAVAPLPAGETLHVRGRHLDVTVVGTAFTVHSDATRSSVQVQEGQVRVHSRGATRLLGAGMQASAGPQGFLPPADTGQASASAWQAIALRIDQGTGVATRLGQCAPGGELRLPADTPVNIRIEGPPTLRAIRSRLVGSRPLDPETKSYGRVEKVVPYHVFGDQPHGGIYHQRLAAGKHLLEVEAFADEQAEQRLLVFDLHLILE